MGLAKIWLQKQLRLGHCCMCPAPCKAHLLFVWVAPAVALPIKCIPNQVLQQFKHKSITKVFRLCACHCQQCISTLCTALPPGTDSSKNSICPEVPGPGWALRQCIFHSRIWDECIFQAESCVGYAQRCGLVPLLSSFCPAGSQRGNFALGPGYSKVSCSRCV